jgi:hypothetical protein
MDDKFIEVLIEEIECFDNEDDMYIQKSYLYINGELVDSNGDHITAILSHLGYDCIVNYI